MDNLKQVNFQNVDMVAYKAEDKIFVGIKSVCEGLGIDHSSQMKRINRDEILKSCVVKMTIKISGQNREVSFMEIDALPLFLTGITSSMCREEIRSKLKEFKLKAKDVLAAAFIKKNLSPMDELKLHYQVLQTQQEDIKEVKADIKDIRENSPLYTIECKELQSLVRKVGTRELGGHGSAAYNDKSLRTKVYSDLQHELRREFGVNRYEAIKRCQLEKAKEIVKLYKAPTVLKEKIALSNNQIAI
jgi:hypothetical protein